MRSDWRIESSLPADGCRVLGHGRHGESAWEWIGEVEDDYHAINQGMVAGAGPARVMAWVEQDETGDEVGHPASAPASLPVL